MFATFVDTALLNGGLNQIIFWDLFFGFCRWFLVYVKSTLNPLFFRASSYSHFAVLKISSLDEFFYSLSSLEFGICFRKLNKTSKKSASLRLVSISRLKPISLNNSMMFFLTLSVYCCLLRFLNKVSPSSRYNPVWFWKYLF